MGVKNRKIMFVHSSLNRGGAEHAMVRISEYLAKNGFCVHIFLTAPVDNSVSYSAADTISVSAISAHCNALHGIRRYLTAIMELRKKIRKVQPDVVVAMNSSAAVDLTLACCFMRVKKVACERANPYLSMKGTIWYYLKVFFSRFMNGYIFQTRRAAGFYPVCVQNIMAVIPNSVSTVSENHYDSDSKLIISVGNLREVKGHDVLIKAFAMLKNHSYSLVICGEGKQRGELERLISKLNLQGRVSLPGKINDVSQAYRRACMFVLSSHHEGMPNALMEAMSYGLPCVSTDCPMGPAELITSGSNGVLVQVGNVAAMAQAMDELIASPELRRKLSKNAFEINRTHSPELIGEMWVEYLQQI